MKKSLAVTILAIALIFVMGVAVFADTPDLSDLLPANNTTTENTVANNTVVNTTNTVVNTVNNTTANNTTKPEKLVNTGLESTTIPLIAILAIASIYAYKKVRDYNV